MYRAAPRPRTQNSKGRSPMPPPVDPNAVLMTGENSFIRLSPDGGKTMTDRVSHWRVLWCPAGWLPSTIETLLFPAFADTAMPVVTARFERRGGPWSTATETATAADARIVLSWYDCIEPFVLNAPPGFNDRPIGVFSTFFPARGAQIEINGKVATGSGWAEMRGDRQGSSATLAWSETWVKPRG